MFYLDEIIPSPSAMSSPRPMHVSSGETSLQCNCITHTAFGGLIQSELVCSQCESSSITLDPFLDLQLHISKEGNISREFKAKFKNKKMLWVPIKTKIANIFSITVQKSFLSFQLATVK